MIAGLVSVPTVALLLASLLFAPPLFAADPTSDVLRKVDDHYNHLASLRARYTEHYSGMGLNRTESGTLLLKKPGKMRWSYDHPAGKVFVLDGSFAWFYTPGDAQAQRIPARKLDDLRSPLRFLLGHTQLNKELVNLSVTPENGGYRITGVPRGIEQRVKQLSLWTSSANAIERMKIEEIDGSITEFTFSAIEENVPVKESDFIFQVPAGVGVVNGLPPV
ncbi:MAG: outer membrane lipoprotein carrier protein LolA [Acidobacteriaceae bacterium]|nr:outer membrane lipoprotein carrier protein LolA [Acidobacteriaceae bacterium]